MRRGPPYAPAPSRACSTFRRRRAVSSSRAPSTARSHAGSAVDAAAGAALRELRPATVRERQRRGAVRLDVELDVLARQARAARVDPQGGHAGEGSAQLRRGRKLLEALRPLLV